MINEENEWNGEVEVNIIQGPLDKVTKGEPGSSTIKGEELGPTFLTS